MIGLPAFAGAHARPFDPASVGNLLCYVRSDRNAFQDSAGTVPCASAGDAVGYLGDLSGNGNHARQSTTGRKPTWQPSIWGTSPGVLLDGVDDHLVVSSLSLQTWTAFAAFNLNTTAGIVYEHGDLSTSDGGFLYGTTGSTIAAKRGSSSSFKNYATNWDLGSKFVATWQYNGTHASSILRVNGSAVSLTNGGFTLNPNALLTADLHWGARYTSGSDTVSLPSKGYLGALLVYNVGTLTTAQMAQVEAWLDTEFPSY